MVMNNSTCSIHAAECPGLVSVMEKIEAVKNSAGNESQTATLWIQYLSQDMRMLISYMPKDVR